MKKRGKENWRNGKKRHKNAFFQVIKSEKFAGGYRPPQTPNVFILGIGMIELHNLYPLQDRMQPPTLFEQSMFALELGSFSRS